MTLSEGALQALGQQGGVGFERAIEAFGQRWQENALVMENILPCQQDRLSLAR